MITNEWTDKTKLLAQNHDPTHTRLPAKHS